MIKDILPYRRFLSRLSYHIFDGYAFLPNNIMFEVTYRCNLRCKMCGYYGEKGVISSKEELSLKDIEKILDDISSFSPFITITGGEPFIRKDMIEILELMRDRKLKFAILTNGTLINDELAAKITDLMPRFINISIDGPENIHELIRGPNSFNKAINGIKLLKEHNYTKITMNCVISKINFENLIDVVYLANGLNVNLQFQHLQFTNDTRNYIHKKMVKKYFNYDVEDRTSGICTQLYDFDIDKLMKQIREIKRLHAPIRINFYPDLTLKDTEKYYTDLNNYVHSRYCIYPWEEARINPRGELSYCIMEPTAGSLLNNPFMDIWNNDEMQHFRRTLKKEKLFPNCARCCKI